MAMDLKHRLGATIRAYRQARNLTQEQVAEAIERTPEAVSNIERGHSLPSLETVERLADAFGIPLADFFVDLEPKASRQRMDQEARLRALAKAMSDEDLEISVGQAEVLVRVRSAKQ